ncbi:MAG: substrate-binding domain-containing protein, partial [Dehalococcoidia bacterium]
MPTEARLTEILKQTNVSREALARALDVSSQTIDNWCIRRSRIRPDKLERLCTVLQENGAPPAKVAAFLEDELERQGLQIDRWLSHIQKAPPERTAPVFVICWKGEAGSIYGPLARTCREMLDKLSFPAVFLDCCAQHHVRRNYIREAVRRQCSGVVLVGVRGETPDPDDDMMASYAQLSDHGIPCVAVQLGSEMATKQPHMAAVCWDHNSVLDVAVESLANSGHREVGAVLRGMRQSPYHGRFHTALGRHDLPFNAKRVAWHTNDSLHSGPLVPDLQALIQSVSAIWCPPTSLGFLLSACRDFGLSIPKDISIVSSGSADYFKEWAPSLTYVRLPFEQIGRETARLLAQLIDGDEEAEGNVVKFGQEYLRLENATGGSIGKPRKHALALQSNTPLGL